MGARGERRQPVFRSLPMLRQREQRMRMLLLVKFIKVGGYPCSKTAYGVQNERV